MSEAELIFTALAEFSTRQIAKRTNTTGMNENKVASKFGGGIAKKARKELEKKTGKKVVTEGNYFSPSSTKVLPKAIKKKAPQKINPRRKNVRVSGVMTHHLSILIFSGKSDKDHFTKLLRCNFT